jgi:hypothetical protein
MYNFGISEQFVTRKITISIYRATSNFNLHMRIFNLQSLGAPDSLEKKRTKKLFLYLVTTFKGSGEINFYQIVKKKKPTLV